MTNKNKATNLTFEDATLVFRNFSGKVDEFNKGGLRTFSIVIPPEEVSTLRNLGWNVKEREPREEGDPPFYHLPVTVSYRYFPPAVYLISPKSKTKVLLSEEELKVLDGTDIETVDLIINPSFWTVQGKSGVKAYLKEMYVFRIESDLDLKYANLFKSDSEEPFVTEEDLND